ncbi:NADPH-dependent FMN reductase [Amycolatopsis cihanbeyliensis]|uniref:NAD(P)H-dependent FMN reductase n=1 Tax=Amycolatopsis cihanbeyliensis TaxID=1128664 RepID=A0A542DLH6_AMYCI|nr:NAD(P)H-dependent oxidoreductase [Amycolatopsis cihanbeyliensis]TQJ03950.1 NAD(P)H-dependent FMN reductase [Amycolatopsis cihanbeyliensis]
MDRLHLGVIVGSTRAGRFAPVVANWFADQAALRADLTVDVIDLAEAGLPDRLGDFGDDSAPREVGVLTPRLADADGFVVVTPEYNRSFPAPLKTAIDWYGAEWQAKPVGFVSYGGISGGLRAVEQLRLVFAELHATTIRDTVSFANYWDQFGTDGNPAGPQAGRAAGLLLDRITWWARALKEARDKHPYANAAA